MARTVYGIIRPDRVLEAGEVDWPDHPGLDRLRELLTPILDGDLEHVAVLHEGRRADMFVNEVGGLEPKMPRNEVATQIYRAHWLEQHPDDDPESLPAIYGPAVVFSRQVWF